MGKNIRQSQGEHTIGRRVLAAGLAGLVAGTLLALVAATAWSTWGQRQQVLDQTGRDGLNLAHTLGDRFTRSLDAADHLLIQIEHTLAHGSGALSASSLPAGTLDSSLAAASEVRFLAVYDAAGRRVMVTQGATDEVPSIQDSEFFASLRDHPETPFTVGLPLKSAAGWTIPLARRIDALDGRFAGVLVAGVSAEYLHAAFESLDLDRRALLCVSRADGHILFRHPHLDRAVGADTRATVLTQGKHDRQGVVQAISAFDGIERIYAYAKLRSLPLTVTVGIPVESALAPWRQEAFSKVLFTAIVVLITALLFSVLARQLARLERSEARFQAIFRSSPVPSAIFTVDEGRLLDANHAFFQMVGRSPADAVGLTSVELGFLESAERPAASIARLLETGIVRNQEGSFRQRSGALGFGYFSAQVIEIDRKPRVLLMVQDITERRAAQERLQRLSERMLLAAQSANLGIWDWDVQRDVVEWDAAMLRIYGIADQSVSTNTYESWQRALHADDKERALADVERALAQGDIYDSEFRIQRPNGEVRHVKAYGRIQRDEQGRALRLIGINLDVTDQRRAQEVVRGSQALLSAVVATTDDGIVSFGHDLRITMINESLRRAVRRYLGFDPVVGMEATRLVAPERAQEMRRILGQVLAGKRKRAESVFRAADGKTRYLDELYNPIVDADGNVIGASVFVRDVTERRQTEQTIRAVVKGTSTALGEEFFRTLVRELSAALHTRYAFVAELTDENPPRLRAIAVCAHGKIVGNFEQAVAGTPCADALTLGAAFHLSGVQQHFPADARLRDMQVQSYLGVRLSAASGRSLGVLAVMHDVPLEEYAPIQATLNILAGRAGSELERLQSEGERRRVQAILDEAGDFIGSFDQEGRVLYLNTAARRLLGGGAADDVRGLHISQFYPPAAFALVSDIGIPTALRTGLWVGETALLRAGGGEIPVSQLVIAHRSKSGAVGYLSTIVRDLSEQKRTERVLREREEHLRLAQQVGNLGSWERDLVHGTLTWSEQMFRLTGQDPERFKVTREAWLELVHPQDRPRLLALVDEAIAGLRPFSLDHRICLPGGVVRYVHQRAEVGRDGTGRAVRLMGTMQDITERKQAEEALRSSERRFRQLVESTHVIPWAATEELRFTYVGPQSVNVLGLPAEAWYEEGFWASRLHPEDLDWVMADCKAALRRGQDTELEYRMLTANGGCVWLRNMISVVSGEGGRQSLHGYLFDISEEKRAEEQLRLAGEVFHGSGEAIVITDNELRVVSVNPAFTAITGYAAQEAVGQRLYSLSNGVRSQERDREIWERVWQQGFWQGEGWDRRQNGEIYPKWMTVSVVRDINGKPVNYIEIFSDISERKAREDEVRHLAHHDYLTDLPNRILLNDRIAQAVSHAERNRTQVAVMFLDLDRFKNVNDSLGHSVGDKLLQEVAGRLRACMRGSDTVSRQGGDEFVIVMSDVSDANDVMRAAQKVLDAVSQVYSIDGHDLITTPSVGISVYPADGRDVETLLKNADTAMYHAKDLGRNNYQFFRQDMNTRALERLSLERSLRRAIDRGELRLHYQPQYQVRTGRVVGVEALVRWEHPDLGLLAPGKFMPFAEETGLVKELGEWVLHEACRQNRVWQNQGLTSIRVAVNISALQFAYPGLAKQIEGILRDTALEARWLELEMTESVIMKDAEGVVKSLEKLKGLGVELAIDDFGTGHSSLSYLKRFPIDKLKIDKSFVQDITSDQDDAAITSAIIGLTRNLGMRTIAEGVETREQLQFLERHGCDEVQGFLFSKPLTPEECAAVIRGQATRRRPKTARNSTTY